MNFHVLPKRRRIWPYLLGGFVSLLVLGGVAAYFFTKQINLASLIALPVVQEELVKSVGSEHQTFVADVPEWLGLTGPRTYLLLFLNNTEIRPGGGFIGSYAVLTFTNGKPNVEIVSGSEVLDNAADRTKLAVPPAIITKQLGIDRWYFRDSNWSPDFAASSRQTLANYRAENGVSANSIDAVFGITTHVLEELMKITGPITVEGIEFTADNVIEKLEYEVEYGFHKRGLDRVDRKQVLGVLFQTLLERVGPDVLREPAKYFVLMDRLALEKHILGFSERADIQTKITGYGWSGTFAPTTTDYLLWVDANLAALKTDHALERALTYTIKPDGAGLKAVATMQYQHRGKFDWRTTRYRTYARIYVPTGAVLESVFAQGANGKIDLIKDPRLETELGAQVFGVFFTVEPGEVKNLSFTYRLPSTVMRAVTENAYTLSIPKQLGAKTYQLTLDLDFGKTITSASPAEEQKNWGNAVYTYAGELAVDRWFNVTF